MHKCLCSFKMSHGLMRADAIFSFTGASTKWVGYGPAIATRANDESWHDGHCAHAPRLWGLPEHASITWPYAGQRPWQGPWKGPHGPQRGQVWRQEHPWQGSSECPWQGQQRRQGPSRAPGLHAAGSQSAMASSRCIQHGPARPFHAWRVRHSPNAAQVLSNPIRLAPASAYAAKVPIAYCEEACLYLNPCLMDL